MGSLVKIGGLKDMSFFALITKKVMSFFALIYGNDMSFYYYSYGARSPEAPTSPLIGCISCHC
jgi:hypothetical protein